MLKRRKIHSIGAMLLLILQLEPLLYAFRVLSVAIALKNIMKEENDRCRKIVFF